MNNKRQQLIDEIVSDLQYLKKQSKQSNQYAIDCNIFFFEAARSLPKFIPWLLNDYPNIDGRRLLELSDFHLRDGIWEKMLLAELLTIEQWKIPDLLGPIRKKILKYLSDLAENKGLPLIVVSVGSGAMEIERQTIYRLRKKPISQPILFIGIDNSTSSLEAAKNNLASSNITPIHLTNLDPQMIARLITHLGPQEKYLVAIFEGDAMSLDKYISEQSIDLVYYSKFKHHLSEESQVRFIAQLTRLTDLIIEADDYQGLYLPILSLLTNWHHPVLLNGALFSSLRDPDKKVLRSEDTKFWSTRIIPMQGYIKTYHRVTTEP